VSVVDRAKMALAFLSDPRVGKLPRLAVLLAVAYLISPVDLVPDFAIPVVAYLDDITLLWMSLRWLFNRGEQVRVEQAQGGGAPPKLE
jgi:uncharacterized membrane protein YkvA (DUF1232 family)